MKKKVVCILMASVSLVYAAGNGFTKPKTVSMNSLKQQCGEQAGVLLKIIPTLLCSCAQVQTHLVQFLEDIIDANPNGFCSHASKQQVQDRQEKVVLFQKKMESWVREMDAFAKDLQG
jgi:hypothetical protein